MMKYPTIKYFDPATWANSAAIMVQEAIEKALLECGSCGVMLTGGRSAERLYRAWAELPNFEKMHDVYFYFGDERCVPPDHLDSNYSLVMQSLFHRGVPTDCLIFRVEAEDSDREAAAWRYEKGLPGKIDVMLLGVGEDGHIASLFPGSTTLLETTRRVVPVTCPKIPHDRLTISPSVIADAKSIFVLASGSEKYQLLHRALDTPDEFNEIPARLVLGAVWLVDMIA